MLWVLEGREIRLFEGGYRWPGGRGVGADLEKNPALLIFLKGGDSDVWTEKAD